MDAERSLEDLVLSEPSLWLSKDRKVFGGEHHALPGGLYWSTSIGRPVDLVAHKTMAPYTCSMPIDAGRREAAAYARCLEDLVEVCDVGLQIPVEEGDKTITTVGYNIAEVHDDGSMTLARCESD